MKAVWVSMGLYELVVEGLKPVDNAVATERMAYRTLAAAAVGVFVLVVHPDIRERMLEQLDPHVMWQHLAAGYK